MGLFKRRPKRVPPPENATAHETDIESDKAAQAIDRVWSQHIESRITELEREVEYLTRGSWTAEHNREESGS